MFKRKDHLELSRVAGVLSNLRVGVSHSERWWKRLKHIWSKERNRMRPEKAAMMCKASVNRVLATSGKCALPDPEEMLTKEV